MFFLVNLLRSKYGRSLISLSFLSSKYYNLPVVKITRILKLNRKRVVILAVILLAAILAFNFFNRPKNQTLQFTSVKKQDVKSTVSSSGTLTGKNVADLKFKSSGRLAYINVQPGDKVFAYQAIAGLDTKLLEIDLQQAQNTLRDKQATAEKTEDDVKDHSKDETYTQRATRTTAQAARDSAYDAVKEAQEALNEANIYTPIAGIITQAPIAAGQNVSASDLIAQIVDTSELYFDTDLDEADISKVSVGQSAEITLDAYPNQIYSGTVERIIPQIKTTSSGATVVTVRIRLDQADFTFINGLSGQASIIISSAKNVLTVPIEVVGDDNSVFIQTSQGLKPQKVEVGIKSDTDVEIKSGLNEGDTVALNPPVK